MKILLSPHESTQPYKEEWLVESEAELAEIPESAPFGSTALILTNDGLTVKMKNSSGDWITV